MSLVTVISALRTKGAIMASSLQGKVVIVTGGGHVNNTAIMATVPMSRAGFDQLSIEEWDQMMAVNLKGTCWPAVQLPLTCANRVMEKSLIPVRQPHCAVPRAVFIMSPQKPALSGSPKRWPTNWAPTTSVSIALHQAIPSVSTTQVKVPLSCATRLFR